MINVNYQLEWLNPETDEYEYIELDCGVKIYPADPSVGVMNNEPHIVKSVDKDGVEHGAKLTKRDVQWIEDRALEIAKDHENAYKSTPRNRWRELDDVL